jgi:hypothetical protein
VSENSYGKFLATNAPNQYPGKPQTTNPVTNAAAILTLTPISNEKIRSFDSESLLTIVVNNSTNKRGQPTARQTGEVDRGRLGSRIEPTDDELHARAVGAVLVEGGPVVVPSRGLTIDDSRLGVTSTFARTQVAQWKCMTLKAV